MQTFQPRHLPRQDLNWADLLPVIGEANRALARFDGILHGLPNPEVLLAPLVTQEAVLSSRIEGTRATVGEVLRFEAGEAQVAETEVEREHGPRQRSGHAEQAHGHAAVEQAPRRGHCDGGS